MRRAVAPFLIDRSKRPGMNQGATGRMVRGWIATVEQAIGKPLGELQAPDEIVAAFEAWPETLSVYEPELLHWFWQKGRLDKEVLRRVLLDVWRFPDVPTGPWCPATVWPAMFKAAGFLSDDVPKPTRRLVLYRGCTPKRRRGMSWTRYRHKADYFADYWFNQGQGERGHVYKTIARPRDVLAIIYGKKGKIVMYGKEVEVRVKSEFEFVIDARLRPITLVETARARAKRLQHEAVSEELKQMALGVIPIEPGLELKVAGTRRALEKSLGVRLLMSAE